MILITDHQPLTYFKTKSDLSRRHARWWEFLSRFDFEIKYERGANNIADPISRSDMLAALTRSAGGPSTGIPLPPPPSAVQGQRELTAQGSNRWNLRDRSKHHLEPAVIPTDVTVRRKKPRREPEVPTTPSALPAAETALPEEAVTTEIPRLPLGHSSVVRDRILRAYKDKGGFITGPTYRYELDGSSGLYMFKGKVAVPDDLELRNLIISQCHDPPLTGHPGWYPTLKRVESCFPWDTMRFDVYRYVMRCEMCQRNKANKAKEAGTLQPLPVPGRCFSRLNMDSITKLPKTGAGYGSIFVVKDALLNRAVQRVYVSIKIC